MTQEDTLAEISRQLQAAGLAVYRAWGPYLGSADLVIFFELSNTDPSSGMKFYNAPCTIIRHQQQWLFQIRDMLAGLGAKGLDYVMASPEEMIAFTLNYCLGQPQRIEGWSVPNHRHPEWTEQRLRHAIAHARPLATAAWKELQKESQVQYTRLIHESDPRVTKPPKDIPRDEWYACVFVPIEPEDASCQETLWLRRDLQVSYRIKASDK